MKAFVSRISSLWGRSGGGAQAFTSGVSCIDVAEGFSSNSTYVVREQQREVLALVVVSDGVSLLVSYQGRNRIQCSV